jgi:hypothetical protein
MGRSGAVVCTDQYELTLAGAAHQHVAHAPLMQLALRAHAVPSMTGDPAPRDARILKPTDAPPGDGLAFASRARLL